MTMKHKLTKSDGKSIERHIGIRLARLRVERGLKQGDMDEKLGLRKGSTRKFEHGDRFISPAHLLAFSRLLKVEVSCLFPEITPSKSSLAPDPETIADTKRLLRAYYQINDPILRKGVVDLLKEVAEDKAFRPTKP